MRTLSNRVFLAIFALLLGNPPAAATADLLDDLGVTVPQLVAGLRSGIFDATGSECRSLLGFPISDEHAAAIAAQLAKSPGSPLLAFLETRGEFEKALAIDSIASLDRVRLLIRAGRPDEARAALDDETVRHLLAPQDPAYFLLPACLPLEDAQQWDLLREFLRLLAERLTTPDWRTALWAEELDLAWHLDQVPMLLEQAAANPLRLAVFYHRLGNLAERDRLAAGLLENASPDRVAEVLACLKKSQVVKNAAIKQWQRNDLSLEGKQALLAQFLLWPPTEGFEEKFRAWLVQGGDALPLAEQIWQLWAPTQGASSQRTAVLAALLKRHPTEPRFQFLIARQLLDKDPAQAAALFEKIATLPLTANPITSPSLWQRESLQTIAVDPCGDLPFLAISGLGMLNRQDRISAILASHPEWPKLPLVDQVRYLAAGRMDFALVDAVLNADFSKPENDPLAGWLASAINCRVNTRAMPQKLADAIAEKAAELMAGSAQKSIHLVTSDAESLLIGLLASKAIEPAAWQATARKLTAIMAQRGEEQAQQVDQRIRRIAAGNPQLKAAFPADPKPKTAAISNEDFSKCMRVMSWFTLCEPPQIRRMPPAIDGLRLRSPMLANQLGGPNRVPLDFLDRWMGRMRNSLPTRFGLGRGIKEDDQAFIRTLMRHLGADNPRRLLIDVMIAKGILDCADEALKSEAQSSYAALMAGTKEARGTEAFRYVSLVLERADENTLKQVLTAVKSQPPVAQECFLRLLQIHEIQDRSKIELARRELALEDPTSAQQTAEKDADGEKLKELEQRNLTATPEAIELAKRLLDKAARREQGTMERPYEYTAVRVLHSAGILDDWMKNTRNTLQEAGVPVVEILRRFQRIDQRQSTTEEPRSLAYAREIFAADPTDVRSAQQLLGVAATERNVDLLLQCVRALGTVGLERLSQSNVLSRLGTQHARAIFALVCEPNFSGQFPATQTIAQLHQYFLEANPNLAEDFRTWLAARGDALARARHQIAGQLLDAKQEDEAVEVFAKSFVPAPEYPGFPHQFPPLPGASVQSLYNTGDGSFLVQDLEFLRKRNLFGKIIPRIDALGGADPQTMAAFRLAATPTLATFEQLVVPVLGKIAEPLRSAMLQRWLETFEKQPASAALVLRLLEEQAKGANDLSLYRLSSIIQKAALLPDSSRLIATLWARLKQAAETSENPNNKAVLVQSMVSLLRVMLDSADDETWQNYWSWRESEKTPTGQLNHLPFAQAPVGFIEPARLRQVLPRVLEDFGKTLPAEQATGWALAAVATQDPSLLAKVVERLPAESRDAAEVCSLGRGDPMAASPVLGAALEGNGETLLWWNFVAFAPVDRETGGQDIPRYPFPALDGKFDLQLTAGSQPNRQVIIKKLTAVAAAGHLRLRLTPDQRYLALVATDPASGVMRWTRVIDAHSSSGLPMPLSDDDLTARGFKRLAWNGPGGLPAWKIRLAGRDRIDLLDRPWNGKQPITLGAWVSGDGKLEMRCLDAAGQDLKSLELIAWDSPLPVWQFRSIKVSDQEKIPAGTTRLVVSAAVHGYNDGPREFAISNVRISESKP